jgi:hypothetical protein
VYGEQLQQPLNGCARNGGSPARCHAPRLSGKDTQAYRTAQRNFVESMAGYSILSYLFQVRDSCVARQAFTTRTGGAEPGDMRVRLYNS